MVEFQFTPLLIPYVVSAAVTLGLTAYGVRRYRAWTGASETILSFVGIALSVSVWTIARTGELLFVDPGVSRFWLSVVYVGYGGATMSVLFVGLAFTGRRRLLTQRTVGLLLAVPLLVVGVAATNWQHQLLWVSEGFPSESGWWGELVVHRRTFQPLFYMYLLYTATAGLTGLYYLLRMAFDEATVYRRQRLALVAGTGAALVVGVLFALGRQPLAPDFLDLSPIGFAFAGLCFGYAIFQHRLLDVVPVARDTVVEGMRDGYVVLDRNDQVIDLNSAARELFDVTGTAVGEPVRRVLPACSEVVDEHELGTRTETDIELQRGSDRQFLTVTVSSLYDDDQLAGRLLLVQDITDKQRVQRRYQALIENSQDVILVVDRDRVLSYASPSFESVIGIEPEEIVGQSVFELVHREDSERFEALLEQLLEDPGERFRYECRVADADGNWLYVEASVWNLLDNPFVGGIVVNAREITERKQREQELKRANKQLEEFASVISHDLRNPLNVAQGRLELARESGADADHHLDTVGESLERMEAIINDVLTLAREGRSIGETEPVSLGATARAGWGHVETGRARLVVADDLTIEADRDRLLQLFENLFRNAVEHAAPGETGTARIRTGADGDSHTSTDNDSGGDNHASSTEAHTGSGESSNRNGNGDHLIVTVGFDKRLYVEDNGRGIPESEREDVLDPGYSTSRSGTGFGLSIVTGIAEAHGWEVEITSSSEGGARFEFGSVESVEADQSSSTGAR